MTLSDLSIFLSWPDMLCYFHLFYSASSTLNYNDKPVV